MSSEHRDGFIIQEPSATRTFIANKYDVFDIVSGVFVCDQMRTRVSEGKLAGGCDPYPNCRGRLDCCILQKGIDAPAYYQNAPLSRMELERFDSVADWLVALHTNWENQTDNKPTDSQMRFFVYHVLSAEFGTARFGKKVS